MRLSIVILTRRMHSGHLYRTTAITGAGLVDAPLLANIDVALMSYRRQKVRCFRVLCRHYEG